jgi:regulator of sigma E protease
LLYAILVILMLSVLVLFHELGHLLLAKRVGVYCHEFAIGMGPKLFSFKGKETLYTIRLLPLGGFVRMAGEEERAYLEGQSIYIEEDEHGVIRNFYESPVAAYRKIKIEKIDFEKRVIITDTGESFGFLDNAMIYTGKEKCIPILPYNRLFQSKTKWQRSMIIVAGPVANILLAFLLIMYSGFTNGVYSTEPVVGEIINPGANTVLHVNDRILQINGEKISTWSDVSRKLLTENNTGMIQIQVLRNGTVLDITQPLTPNTNTIFLPTKTRNLLIVAKDSMNKVTHFIDIILTGIKKLISGEESVKNLSGPVGIIKMSYDISKEKADMFILWSAALSINLAIFNLLPFPALDGGRLSFIIYELVRGKPVDRKKENFVHFAGFALLMVFAILVTWQDIQRIF